MKHWSNPINFLLLSVVLSGCTSSKRDGDFTITLKSKKGEPLTQVGKLTFTVEELREDFLERQGTFRGAPNLNSDNTRSEFIENQVSQEAMFQEAVKLGYMDKSDVRRDFKKIVVQKFMRDKLEEAQKNFVPTDEMIKAHYEKNPNLYNREEAMKVAYIAIPFSGNQENAKKAATLLYKDAVLTVKNGNSSAFSRVPINNSSAVGKMGVSSVETNESEYLTKADFDKKFGAGSFESIKNTSEVGQVHGLASVNETYIILMKTGYRKALNDTVDTAKDKIIKRLSYESRGDFYKQMVAELKKKYDIKVFENRIAELSKDALETNVAYQEGMAKEKAREKAEAEGKDLLKKPEEAKPAAHN